jgi:hypothetical protein
MLARPLGRWFPTAADHPNNGGMRAVADEITRTLRA